LKHEEGARDRIDLGARLGPAITACIGVPTRGVRGSRLMHWVPGGWPESATMAAPRTWHKRIVRSGPRTASSPAADSGAVGLLTVPSDAEESNPKGRFCARSIELPLLVEVVEAQFQLGPAHERGQLPKDDG
jgi:hypothetical protein